MDTLTWCWCPVCWGQQKIYESAKNGEGLIPVPCSQCFATGSVLVQTTGGKSCS